MSSRDEPRGRDTRRPARALLGVLIVACLLSLVACSDDRGTRGTGAGQVRTGPAGSTSTPGPGGTGGSGMGGTGMRGVGEQRYLTMMVAHHRDAMAAAAELSRSLEPAMRGLGRRIVHGQSEQVRTMQGWLARWYPAALPADHAAMVGDLSGLSGGTLDQTFLTEMVPHHTAAVMMSRRLLMSGRVRHREVGALARSVISAQSAEIRWMRHRLDVRQP